MLVIQTLTKVSDLKSVYCLDWTHKPPSKKSPITPNFFDLCKCRFHTIGIGRHKINTSVTIFPLAVKRARAMKSIQCAVGFGIPKVQG